MGFTTSKKLGKAVIRNRIRRRLKEMARLSLTQWPHEPKAKLFEIVLIGRIAAKDQEFDKLCAECIKAFHFIFSQKPNL